MAIARRLISTIVFIFLLLQKDSVAMSGDADSVRIQALLKSAYNDRSTNPHLTRRKAMRALSWADSLGSRYLMAEAHRILGIGFFYSDEGETAIRSYYNALGIFSALDDATGRAKVYNNIGNVHSEIDDEKALSFYRKSLSLSDTSGDSALISGVYLNIATALTRMGDYTGALASFERSRKFAGNHADIRQRVLYFQNTGLLSYYLKDYEKAERQLAEAVNLATPLRMNRELAGCYLTLSGIAIDRGNLDAAQRAAEKGMEAARLLRSDQFQSLFSYRYYQIERAQGRYKSALDHLASAYSADSTLLLEKQLIAVNQSSDKQLSDIALKQHRLMIAEQQLKATRFWWIVTGVAAIFLLLVIIVSWAYYIAQRKRRRRELEVQNDVAALEQRALQAMMNPHFVFNILNSVQYFINIADSESANRVLSGFAKLIRKHLEISINSYIALKDELEYLALYLALEKIRFADKMNYSLTIAEGLDTDNINLPSMLIQPFIENALWHGIMPMDSVGNIRVSFDRADEDLIILISDDGVGIDNSVSSKSAGHISRGMALIRERVRLINKLSARPISINQFQKGTSGTEVVIRIPVETHPLSGNL